MFMFRTQSGIHRIGNDTMAGSSRQQTHVLYAEHHGWLFGWLRGKIGNASDAADLAHDTFVRILASRHLPDNLGQEPRALLAHIAKGLVIDHWRRQDVQRVAMEALRHLPESFMPSPEERLVMVEALVRVDAMLASLPARTRQVFLLAQLEGLTLQRISEQAGMPVITVRRHIRKALLACMSTL